MAGIFYYITCAVALKSLVWIDKKWSGVCHAIEGVIRGRRGSVRADGEGPLGDRGGPLGDGGRRSVPLWCRHNSV